MTPTDTRPLPPQLSANAAEFFEQAADTVSDTFNQIGEQAHEFGQQAYRFFSDLTCVVSEQVSETSEAIGSTLNKTAASIGEVAANIANYVADTFSNFAQWAQENPAYAIGGLVGTVAAGFGIYYLVGAARIHYQNVTRENSLQAELDTAIEGQAEAEKILNKARTNYLAAYGLRHLIQNHPNFLPAGEEKDASAVLAEGARLGALVSAPMDPGENDATSIGHYRFLYNKAAEFKISADAKFADKSMSRRMFHRAPVFTW